jgi:type IV secretion system protein VirB4
MQAWQPTAAAELSVPDMVPFSSEIAPGVIKLRNQLGYCATIELEGIDFETCSDDYITVYNQQLDAALRSLDAGCAVWTHKVKAKALHSFRVVLPDATCQWISDSYLAKLNQSGFVETRLFLTVVIPGASGKSTGTLTDYIAREQEAVQSMDSILRRIESTLVKYRPTRLGQVHNAKGVLISQSLSLYSFLANGRYEDVPVTTKQANHLIASSRLTFAERSGVVKIESPSAPTRYASSIEIRVYPSTPVTPVSISGLLYVEQDYIETQSFSILSDSDAVEKFRRQRSHMQSGGEASQAEIADIAIVIDELRAKRVSAGEYHYSLTVFGDSLKDIERSRIEVMTVLEAAEFKAVVQTTLPEAAWFFQLPGNWRMRTRIALMTSRNFATLAPMHSFMQGKKSGNPWGQALALFSSPSGQPYHFNFHYSDPEKDVEDDKIPGNTVLFGSTGVGKTTLETYLICMLTQYRGRTMILDMDRSTEIAVRAFGGTYKSFLRGVPTGINIFQWADTPSNRAFCKRIVTLCVTRNGVHPLTIEEENKLSSAVDTVYLLPLESRRLGIVLQNLPASGGNSLSERLRRWVGQGDLAWVLDNPRDTLDLQSARLFGADYSEFIDDPDVSGIFVATLLEAAEALKDGQPFVLIMEEFWKPLETSALERFVKDQLKTIRKENGLVLLTTQQPDDVTQTPLAKTAIQQTQTGIFMPNPKANWDDYKVFGVTRDEFELVKELPEQSRTFLVKQGGKSAVCIFDLGGMPEVIAILSGNKENVKKLDLIRQRVGDRPADWLPVFLKEVA